MTLFLKQSTSIKIRMGPYVDLGDGATPEAGLTIGAADQAEVLKANGAATVAMSGTFAAVSDADGWYDYTVATGDVDTVGEVVFSLQDSSVARPAFTRGYVLEEAVYDALFAASAGLATDIAAILVDTGTTLPALLPTALVGGRMDSTIDATGMESGAVSNILTTQMTEAYAADGAAPTLAQALMMIQQILGDFAISGTTLTVNKVDGATAAATFTLDSASTPTSLTRTT